MAEGTVWVSARLNTTALTVIARNSTKTFVSCHVLFVSLEWRGLSVYTCLSCTLNIIFGLNLGGYGNTVAREWFCWDWTLAMCIYLHCDYRWSPTYNTSAYDILTS